MTDNLPKEIWAWQQPGLGYTARNWEVMSEAPTIFPGETYVQQSELTTAQARITELEAQLKMVLDRESATQLRHDEKLDKLEGQIRAADRLSKAVTTLSEDKTWFIRDLIPRDETESAIFKFALIVGHNSIYNSAKGA